LGVPYKEIKIAKCDAPFLKKIIRHISPATALYGQSCRRCLSLQKTPAQFKKGSKV
jgi:hypothetical protein